MSHPGFSINDLLKAAPMFVAFKSSLHLETDSGCALRCSSLLDVKLGELLAATFVSESEPEATLLGKSKPLGTFSVRIDMCFAMGLLGPKARRDLHLIRKIRNEFGHEFKPLDFEAPRIANRCRELFYVAGQAKSSRERFTGASLTLLLYLIGTTVTGQRISSGKDIDVSVSDLITKDNESTSDGV
jgi:DNA-binding MltR family transcriptional regulator